jgi:hypothetical protein
MGDTEEVSSNNVVDDQGTTESEGRALLKRLRDAGFEGSDDKLATALGRPVEDVAGLIAERAQVDDDIIIKARGIAEERGLEID